MSLFRTLSTKPWVAERGYVSESHGFSPATPKVFLSVFLGVVSAVFALLTAAYFIRMAYADWQSIPVPALLWLNSPSNPTGRVLPPDHLRKVVGPLHVEPPWQATGAEVNDRQIALREARGPGTDRPCRRLRRMVAPP